MAEETRPRCEVTMHSDYVCGQPARIHVNGFPCCAHHFEEYEQEGLIESVSIPAESAPPPAASPLGQATCAGSYPGTIRDLVHRLEVCVAEEQERPLPRNHFIAVFCDVIRYMRDEGGKPFATVEQPAESLNAWAVRCLDLWAAHQEDSAMVMVLSRTGPDWCYGVHGRDRKPLGYLGETPDAARISAARALCADQPDLFPREPGT